MIRAEAIFGSYLRERADIVALDARVAGSVPRDSRAPWVRVTQLDATDNATSDIEYLLDYMVQFDCYAGRDATTAEIGQTEALNLAIAVRVALKAAEGQVIGGASISRVRFTSMPRIPDGDFEPARERYVLTAEITGHA